MSSNILTLANILYVLVSVGMIVMILLQRGAGAAAGSGFGGGASATVFGSRGSANFLSKSTALLAILFFVVSLGMAMYVARNDAPSSSLDLGVMGESAPTAIPDSQIPDSAPAVINNSSLPVSGPASASPAATSAQDVLEAPVGSEKAPSEGDSGE